MREISLKDAVTSIHQICEQAKEEQTKGKQAKKEYPFFFIVGAGISSPPVPLAPEIIDHCKKEADKYGKHEEPVPEPRDTLALRKYSHWFEKAYPAAERRRRYLHGLIDNRQISRANLRLAHLLSGKKIASLAVTPNFDDFLSRALSLFGIKHVVCDHPLTGARIDPEDDGVAQIVHVHGSHWFYDCCNLTGEIKDRAAHSEETAGTMPALLDRILHRRSALVVGYSGWEGDVIMKSLKRRLKERLPYNLYWFCHRRSNIENLPDWLKKHQDVFFVMPPEARRDTGDKVRKTITEAEAEITKNAQDNDKHLTAEDVFSALIQKFNLQPPKVLSDPLGYFAGHLESSFPVDSPEEKGDVYSFKNIIGKVKTAGELLTEKEYSKKATPGASLDPVLNAMRRLDYPKAVTLASKIDIKALDYAQKSELASLMLAASTGLNDNPDYKLKAYDLIIAVGNGLPGLDEMTAKALVNKGVTLGELGESKEEIKTYDILIERFGNAKETHLREQVARALVNKGATLGELGESKEAIKTYDILIERFGNAKETPLREGVARTLNNKGVTLGKLGESKEAIKAYDILIERFGNAKETPLREQVTKALFNKGVTLGKLGESKEAIKIYDLLIEKFGDTKETHLREQVAKALNNKGVRLGKLGESKEAIKIYDLLIEKFGDAKETPLREGVARTLNNKGVTLGELGESKEEIKTYDIIIEKFGDAKETPLREQVARALNNKGVTLGELDESIEAIKAYDILIERFGNAKETPLREQVAKALNNKGVTLGKLGESKEEIKAYDIIIEKFGDAKETPLREQVASALFNKGVTLGKLGESKEEIKTYEELINMFKDAKEPSLREIVTNARKLLEKAKYNLGNP